MIDLVGEKIAHLVEEAIARMVSAEHFRAGSLVSMPMLYPSGASVVLEITAQQGRCFVSDRGGGYQEAEFAGATRIYATEAERLAREAGIKFDGRDMFVAEVSFDMLEGALVIVANCSQTAASLSTLRSADKTHNELRDELLLRLSKIFPIENIDRKGEISGPNHKWKVSAVVSGVKGRSAFDAVSSHYNSVVNTTAKFHDLARLSVPPKRIAVLRSRKELGDFVGVLSGASSSVVEMSATNATFVELVAA